MLFFALLGLIVSGKARIALGIWAGKETLDNRVMAQAKSWMPFWDDVYVFSDEFPAEQCTKLNEAANPCRIHCIALENLSEHLESTEWTHRWYFAQPRFLPAMASLYENNPTYDWFLFGDDDTYFFKPPVDRKIRGLDPNTDIAVGKFWCSWERMTQFVPPIRDCHPFAQGGAGVLLSNSVMSKLAPNLRNCSLQFNDPDFAGSMRFAICAERVLGTSEWSIGGIINAWMSGFHSSPPQFEISDGTVTEAPASFHRINPEIFPSISDTHTFSFLKKDGTYVIGDLGIFAFTTHRIPIGSERTPFEWRFGYWIGLTDSKKPLMRASSNWKAVIKDDGAIKELSQEYGNEITVKCVCNDELPEADVEFSHFEDDIGFTPVFAIQCKSISFVNRNATKSVFN